MGSDNDITCLDDVSEEHSSDDDNDFWGIDFDGVISVILPTPTSDPHKARVEIFRMTGGSEYVIHDIDDDNFIVGKAVIDGKVKVPDHLILDGFDGSNERKEKDEEVADDDDGAEDEGSGETAATAATASNSTSSTTDSESPSPSQSQSQPESQLQSEPQSPSAPSTPTSTPTPTSSSPPSPSSPQRSPPKQTDASIRRQSGNRPISGLNFDFSPPSFGITTLGNSHGFDPAGSVSGYVLWINGRGIMIDPPPYASTTLGRAGILPNMIAGIIITHCHADHDAGAFQRVLLGRRILVIKTPTIYESFITKYSALSLLSPNILKRSHRYKQAIIGLPLQLLGATFHFFYTLHTIPCVGFRVEWRNKSIVFSADHLNDPKTINMLIEKGIMSKARGEALNNMPLQDTNLLLHETGVPPIHTPVAVLEALPERVKAHMYVVHTSALKPNCSLKIAPTGTAGTIKIR